VEDDARDTLVPFMLLQPLLENSIKHGLGNGESSLDLAIDVRRANGSTIVRVSDNGSGYVAGATWGIGLSNTASRLQYMYGDRASLSIERAQPQGTVATVTLPAKEL
jgi:two-component system LytT family sensor kinase